MADLQRGFRNPPDDARMMMRWWWFGPAATKTELEREMRAMKAGDNAIRIVAGNSALNIMAKGPLPDYKELTAKYGERFQAQDMHSVAPQPSGLLGPVRLVGR